MRINWLLLGACLAIVSSALADDWPQWRGENRDGVWREDRILRKFPAEGPEVQWRAPIGSGYSGPTVASGKVYVTDRLVEPKQIERVHCFDERSGEKLWSHEYDCPYVGVGYQAGPRASVTIDNGSAFALGTMGNLFCFDAASGAILWQRDLNAELKIRMPDWGIAAAPLVYRDRLILQIGGADGACIVALNTKTGKEEWRALDDRAGYSAPILIKQAGEDVVVCWTGDSVAGIDPKNGKVFWRFAWPPRNMPIGISTPVVQGDRLFLTDFYDGALMLRLHQNEPTVEKLWLRVGRSERDTDALQSIISTPVFLPGVIYGCDSHGELRCLDPQTGDRIWTDLTATPPNRWSNIHFVQNGPLFWLFNEKGELIIAKLSKQGFHEIDRAKIIEPTTAQLSRRGGVTWAHPAFAGRHVFVRNDQEIICVSLKR
ncbi:PQQ-like beta-propeller repeat protein [Blastopirellula sp. J2-11]|uniref:PQQ-binding-like beta-propeller repeat protein n=1 Tax=Blastopirellula sp. J2-11 TaxID=2943192 RepID=UPI0021C75552|nr:PQQ-binding-like beta-propeller repeat protein [Blastopirellula sp. J2-11]UUO07780.1 PQQ-like beta-propeller repeat protein [Blastopirellula sp. J2-11]